MKLSEKLFKRITSPVEVVYDLTRHWFILLFAITLGSLWMFAKVTSEPGIFEGFTTLVLSPNEILVDLDGRSATAKTDANFMAEQLSLLKSDQVAELVVRVLGEDQIMAQEADGRSEEDLGVLQRSYRKVTTKVRNMMDLLAQDAQGTLSEQSRYRAKSAFRRRSAVQPQKQSNIVKLTVVGTSRIVLQRELDAWIKAYIMRIEELSKQTYEKLFETRVTKWELDEKDAKQVLDKFREEHDGVSLPYLELVRERVIKLRLMLAELERKFLDDSPEAQDPLKFLDTDQKKKEEDIVIQLRRKKEELEAEFQLLRAKYPPASRKLLDAEAAIKNLEERIEQLQDPLANADGTGKVDLESKMGVVKEELKASIKEQVELEENVLEFNRITEEYRKSVDMKRKYMLLRERRDEMLAARKIVDIQIQDPPTGSVQPLGNYHYLKVGYGTMAGAAIGFVCAFALEFMNRRLRFKRDVEELGLKVVGVIPGA